MCGNAAERSKVDGTQGRCSCVCGEPHVSAFTGSKSACIRARTQEGALLLLPARKELLLKSSSVFLSACSVCSVFVCNLRPVAPEPPTAGSLPHICLAALVF